LYARARRGQITGFTGVDDPYETPVDPELTLFTVDVSPEENAYKIIGYLEGRGFLPPVRTNVGLIESEQETMAVIPESAPN
jgi:hypothetical protein